MSMPRRLDAAASIGRPGAVIGIECCGIDPIGDDCGPSEGGGNDPCCALEAAGIAAGRDAVGMLGGSAAGADGNMPGGAPAGRGTPESVAFGGAPKPEPILPEPILLSGLENGAC
jgi:hypothetical protein